MSDNNDKVDDEFVLLDRPGRLDTIWHSAKTTLETITKNHPRKVEVFRGVFKMAGLPWAIVLEIPKFGDQINWLRVANKEEPMEWVTKHAVNIASYAGMYVASSFLNLQMPGLVAGMTIVVEKMIEKDNGTESSGPEYPSSPQEGWTLLNEEDIVDWCYIRRAKEEHRGKDEGLSFALAPLRNTERGNGGHDLFRASYDNPIEPLEQVIASLKSRDRVGILGMEIYFPPTYVRQKSLEDRAGKGSRGKFTNFLGQESMSFCTEVEDLVSMSLTVVTSLLQKYQINPLDIGRLDIAGDSHTQDKTKSVRTYLMKYFEIYGNTDVEGADISNSCYGGTAALFSCVNWVESQCWDKRYGLVVCADNVVYEEPALPTGGAAAIAMLIGPNAPITFENKFRGSCMCHAYDCYKLDLNIKDMEINWEGEQASYLLALESCYKLLCEKYKNSESKEFSISDADYFIFHSPYNKLVERGFAHLMYIDINRNVSLLDKDARELATKYMISDGRNYSQKLDMIFKEVAGPFYDAKVKPTIWVPKQVGNMGTASIYAALASLLHYEHKSLDDKRVIVFSYGNCSNATMYSLQLRVGNDTFSLTNIVEVMQLKEKMASRTEFSANDFCKIMKTIKQKGQNKNGGKHSVSKDTIPLLLGGTYYVKETDKYRTSYAKKGSESIIVT